MAAEPDDLAVALGHDPERQDLPRVVAKGRGAIAAQIVAVAEANGVPVRRDPDLARVLGALELDAPIPTAAFVAVAEILARIYRANGRAAARGGAAGGGEAAR
ncbi:MAG TPA: EscU/YscU/HrcU family type III secretion system export apparatus switch protein [Geminicoccaceae bacterium]|nr:EscU/YscU/HrcU family type III secretion system export apparatus switch protein [Geminicoccaceae bacterium]